MSLAGLAGGQQAVEFLETVGKVVQLVADALFHGCQARSGRHARPGPAG